MQTQARLNILLTLCFCALSFARADSKLDTSQIDAVLGRSGTWTEGVYAVFFPRPDLRVTRGEVQLSTTHVVSFATFTGSQDNSEMMGEICALPNEVTPSIAKLRAGGIEITSAHDHFLGESPRLTFVHFMARGRAVELARSFRTALAATTTPLGKLPPPTVHPKPDWAKAVQSALGRQGDYSSEGRALEVDVFRADYPAGPMDFWYSSALFFQRAPSGAVAATGDVAITAGEVNQVLTILTEHDFDIEGVHNHMIDEQPRLFFVHYWKVGTPQDLAEGLKATLAVVHIRQK